MKIEQIKSLVGGLSIKNSADGQHYDTVKGRVFKQIVKAPLYQAYMFKSRDESPVPAADAKLYDLEETCMPYKSGIDASTDTGYEPDTTYGIYPRKTLLRDLVDNPDVDSQALDTFSVALKNKAIQEQLEYMQDRKLTNINRKIQVGLAGMDEDTDGVYDEEFLRKAAEFVVQYPPKYPTENDLINLSRLQQYLDGEEEVTDEKSLTSDTAPVFNI